MEFTGCSDAQAQTVLKQRKWDAEQASELFFSSGMSPEVPSPSSSQPKSSNSKAKTEKLEAEFLKVEDQDEKGYLGLEAFLSHIGVKTEDPVCVVALYHMKTKPGVKTKNGIKVDKNEFMNGMVAMDAADLNGLKAKLPYLRSLLGDNDFFSKFWPFVYGVNCIEPDQTKLPIDVVLDLTRLFLKKERWAAVDLWCEFLEKGDNKKTQVNKDTWTVLLDFAKKVNITINNNLAADKNRLLITGYDETDAWPGTLDNFIEYLQSTRKS
jgi:hypothetical protein